MSISPITKKVARQVVANTVKVYAPNGTGCTDPRVIKRFFLITHALECAIQRGERVARDGAVCALANLLKQQVK